MVWLLFALAFLIPPLFTLFIFSCHRFTGRKQEAFLNSITSARTATRYVLKDRLGLEPCDVFNEAWLFPVHWFAGL